MSCPAPASVKKCIIMHAMHNATAERAPGRAPEGPRKKKKRTGKKEWGGGRGGAEMVDPRKPSKLSDVVLESPSVENPLKNRDLSIFGSFFSSSESHETLRLLRFREGKPPVLQK